MLASHSAFYAGMSLGASLIIVIGAQNALVLKQGLKNQHVFVVCLICALSDALLIALGVGGFYLMVAKFPWLEVGAKYGGAMFLVAYGARSFYAAWQSSESLKADEAAEQTRHHKNSRLIAIYTCLALTWLNPHVYLDTVVLLGSVSTHYPGHKIAFASGATVASFLFFFALGYGARMLTPIFSNPFTWKTLDFIIGGIMWGVAATLIFG